MTLRWRHNGHDSVSNHQPHHFLLNRLFGCRSKKTSKLRVTGFCAGNSPGTGEFPAQSANNAENVSIWWRHHEYCILKSCPSIQTSHCVNHRAVVRCFKWINTYILPPTSRHDIYVGYPDKSGNAIKGRLTAELIPSGIPGTGASRRPPIRAFILLFVKL